MRAAGADLFLVSVYTVVGMVVLYKEFPKELRPSRVSIAVLAAGFVFYVYIIVRALASFFGKSA